MTCINFWYSYLAQTALVEDDSPIVHNSITVAARIGGSITLVSWKHKIIPCISVGNYCIITVLLKYTHFYFKNPRK